MPRTTHNTFKGSTRTRPWRATGKNYFIYCKNSVTNSHNTDVRNVLVIVAISQKDPLQEFNSEHYRTVVKCAKDLLKSLYDRVLKSDEQEDRPEPEIEHQPIPRKLYVLPELHRPPKFTREERLKDDNRPNYVGARFKPHSDRKSLRRKMDIKYLDSRIKELAYSLENLINEFG